MSGAELQARFDALARAVRSVVRGDEFCCAWLQAEDSHFIRINQGRLRQAGSVCRAQATLRLIVGARQASLAITLADDAGPALLTQVSSAVDMLRAVLEDSEDDPLLDVCRDPVVSDDRAGHPVQPGDLDDLIRVLASPLSKENSLPLADQGDLVGFVAAGSLGRGFCSSAGAMQWFERASISVDGSIHLPTDPVSGDRRAVKFGWSGETPDAAALAAAVERARREAAVLLRPARRLAHGDYRALLQPRAFADLLGMLEWGGYSARAHRSGQSPLARLRSGQAAFSPLLNLAEDLDAGFAPAFQADGYPRARRVELIRHGQFADWLVSPASAREFDLTGNAANAQEVPESVVVGCGTMHDAHALNRLETGVLLSNLWYLNYSDREACRITGMTRFACLWVEHGEAVAPIEAMRFDDSLFRVLGAQGLEALGQHAERMPQTETWEGRATGGILAPAALVAGLRFTL
ncbi:MAG: metallopeptidase TldD-related protein [Burkholderiaceae bacterium]